MKLGRAACAACLAAMVLVALATPAAADDGMGHGWVDNQTGNIGAGANSGSSSAGSGGGSGGGSGITCTYSSVDAETTAAAEDMAKNGWGSPRGTGPGSWMRQICSDGTGNVVWVAQQVDPAALARQALDQANVPLPGVGMNPAPPHDAVVNMPTWLWVQNYAPVRASASAGAVTVTVTAAPAAVRWAMGNGDVVVCNGAGTRYDTSRPPDQQHTDCSYTYRRSSASAPSGTFVMQTTVTWNVTWTATGIAAGGSLGPLARTSSTPVRVSEIQAVNE